MLLEWPFNRGSARSAQRARWRVFKGNLQDERVGNSGSRRQSVLRNRSGSWRPSWRCPRQRGSDSFPSACFYDKRLFMKKPINDNQKRRGRPATGTAPLVGVRMTPDFQKNIKAWSKAQADKPSLAEAIRRLVELGLT